MQLPLQQYLDALYARLLPLRDGEVASYIPELSKANPDWFGISIVTMDGVAYSAGEFSQRFTIQSVSKAFVYATALEDRGRNRVMEKIGVEPSGEAFNSISLQPQTGAPMNPMINAGAIAATSMIAGETSAEQWKRLDLSLATFAGRQLDIDDAVYQSESETGDRNRAIAWMLKNFNIIERAPMAALENYFRQCSMLVSCQDLAYMAATLANGGVHPVTQNRALASEHVDRVLSVMATCGMYDYAGSWLYEVGMPAKSGVGGGIIAVLPGRFGIGVFSPLLDAKGNSVRGIEACKAIAADFGVNIFSRAAHPKTTLSRIYTAADAPSSRKPSREMKALLTEQASRIKYLSLQGNLSVDSVDFIIRQMRELAAEAASFILDMHLVVGISESAARFLNQARREFSADGIAVVFSRIHRNTGVLERLRRATTGDSRGILRFEDNDLAVEWCENQLCAALTPVAEIAASLTDFSLFQGLSADVLNEISDIASVVPFAAGDTLVTQGQPSDSGIFFVQKGQVSIIVPTAHASHQRIASLGGGMSFGEMVLLGQTTRSASAVADTAGSCLVLDTAAITRLSDRHVHFRETLLENISRELASNLRRATRWIGALA